ncbi:MAG: response regulator [Magnetococcales bacterium]|nr:response regulator [Magnetococcales bacterium]
MRILIVDDESPHRFILEQMLKPVGECDLAVSGAEAVELFQTAHQEGKPYDFICMDILMPTMDGHETLQRLRALERAWKVPLRKETVVFMVTSVSAEKDVVDSFFKDGCTDYLIKPVMKHVMMEKLREYGLFARGEGIV